jgi:Na+-driven multidrug efflux pump
LGNACAILIGNRIGADEQTNAIQAAKKTPLITVFSGLVMGLAIFLIKDPILRVYNISAETRQYASTILSWISLAMVFKTCNIVLIIGILRAGGDTRFTLGIELITIWGFGVPAAWISANIFHLPVYWIVPVVLCEEVIKAAIVFSRYRSKKWIHHLAHSAV